MTLSIAMDLHKTDFKLPNGTGDTGHGFLAGDAAGWKQTKVAAATELANEYVAYFLLNQDAANQVAGGDIWKGRRLLLMLLTGPVQADGTRIIFGAHVLTHNLLGSGNVDENVECARMGAAVAGMFVRGLQMSHSAVENVVVDSGDFGAEQGTDPLVPTPVAVSVLNYQGHFHHNGTAYYFAVPSHIGMADY